MSARDRIVVAALAALVAVAAFWFFGVAPKRKQITIADAQIAAQQVRLQKAQAVLAGAQQAKREYPANSAEVARLGKAVPADDNVASLVYELQGVARGAKINFRSIKLNGSTSNGGSAPASGATATGSASSATGTAAAPATQVAASQLPPGAIVGTAGLATLPFTFGFEGSYLDMQRFVARVNRFVAVKGHDVAVTGRLLTIDGLSLMPSTDQSGHVKATIAATAYLAPPSSAADATGATGTTGATGAAGAGATADAGTGTAPAAGTSSTTSAVTAAPAGS